MYFEIKILAKIENILKLKFLQHWKTCTCLLKLKSHKNWKYIESEKKMKLAKNILKLQYYEII